LPPGAWTCWANRFEIEAISRRLAFFRDPWGNMIELSETLPGA
jgi:lactoylglutathione lyase/glyoxylase I family protein